MYSYDFKNSKFNGSEFLSQSKICISWEKYEKGTLFFEKNEDDVKKEIIQINAACVFDKSKFEA